MRIDYRHYLSTYRNRMKWLQMRSENKVGRLMLTPVMCLIKKLWQTLDQRYGNSYCTFSRFLCYCIWRETATPRRHYHRVWEAHWIACMLVYLPDIGYIVLGFVRESDQTRPNFEFIPFSCIPGSDYWYIGISLSYRPTLSFFLVSNLMLDICMFHILLGICLLTSAYCTLLFLKKDFHSPSVILDFVTTIIGLAKDVQYIFCLWLDSCCFYSADKEGAWSPQLCIQQCWHLRVQIIPGSHSRRD